MTINIDNRPSITLEINLPDQSIELKVYTDTPNVYKAINTAYRNALEVEDRVKKAIEKEHAITKSVEVLEALEYQASNLIDAIEFALGIEEFSKIGDIVNDLPLKALRDIVSAIADAMCNQLIDRIKENKI